MRCNFWGAGLKPCYLVLAGSAVPSPLVGSLSNYDDDHNDEFKAR